MPPNNPEDVAINKFQLELGNFGTRSKSKFKIVDDLSLCMRTCSTPEVKLNLREAMRKSIAEIENEMQTLEQKLKKSLEMAAKEADKKKDKGGGSSNIAEKQKQTSLKLKLQVDDFNKKFMPSDHSVWLELSTKPKNEPPFVDVKKTSLTLGYTLKF